MGTRSPTSPAAPSLALQSHDCGFSGDAGMRPSEEAMRGNVKISSSDLALKCCSFFFFFFFPFF